MREEKKFITKVIDYTRYEELVPELPDQLKRVFSVILAGGYYKSLEQICEELGFDAKNVRSQISRLRREKGINFYRLWTEVAKEAIINEYTPQVWRVLAEKAVRGSLKAIELYLRAVGELRDAWNMSVEVNATVNTQIALVNALKEAKERLEQLKKENAE
ncbi:MAG: hypothetical protein QXT86_12520 [Archaeoglobaceae archaeon]